MSFGHGTGNAFDEAAWLVLWALGMPLDALEAHVQGTRPPPTRPWQKPRRWSSRRIETRVPAAYLTREAWLQNVAFHDRRRRSCRARTSRSCSPTAKTGILDAWLSDKTQRVLDLCTGNGSLAAIAAMAYPEIDGRRLRHQPRRHSSSRAPMWPRHALGAAHPAWLESDLFAGLRARPTT